MLNSHKMRLSVIVVIIIAAVLGAAGYYFIIRKTAIPIVWDGDYKTSGTLSCEGNFPNLTTIPMDSTITVSNNKIVEQIGETVKNFEIDKHGKATELIEPITSDDGVTADGRADLRFYKEDGAYKFTSENVVNLSTTQDGKTYSSTCSGPATGIKQ